MVKVERSFPAPASLSKKKSYKEVDVIRQLKEDFNCKCYICNIDNLTGQVIEHLRPHKNGKHIDLMYDWENLFLSCQHCNSVKNKAQYDNKIIDCCKVDPEKHLVFNYTDEGVVVKTLDPNYKEATFTAMLITEVFTVEHTGHYSVDSEERRNRLEKEMNKLYTYLKKYSQNPTSKTILRTITVLLQRKSPFAAFKRSYVRQHLNYYSDLQNLIN